MAKTNPFMNYKLFVGMFILALGIFSVVVPADTAQAAPCPSNRIACNSDENRARNACFAARPLVQGAIWLNNSDASDTDTGFYAYGINIGATDTSVGINIRGSVYTCGQGAGDWDPSYAVEVQPDLVGGAYPDSGRLTITGGASLYRGNFQGVNDGWTTQGNAVTGVLNVSGLAMNNANSADSQTINIGIYRCYSTNGVFKTGRCDTSIVPVTITRARMPQYTLTPTITVTPSSSVESGQIVFANPVVSSAGGGPANNITWQVSRFVARRGAAIPGAGQNATAPQAYYGNGATSEATSVQNFSPGVTGLPQALKITEDLAVGDQVCYALSVRPYTNTNALGFWAHSAPACVAVSTKPKVQVLGGDLIVGRGTVSNPAAVSKVATGSSYSAVTGFRFGSWSEYAIIPSGTVTGMASGAMYVGGGPNAVNLCDLSVLTISNDSAAGTGSSCRTSQIGMYASGSTAPNVASRFPIPTATGQIITAATQNLSGLTPKLVYTSNRPTLTLNSSAAFGAGRWVVINAPNTTVTINSDINYATGALANAKDIPQVVIIAKNIIIANNVRNLDAWLIASGGSLATGGTAADGRINTCGAGNVNESTLPNATQCELKLTVNGPVMANHLIMRRTAGSERGAVLGAPAEVFNLRGDAYLWASVYSSSTGRIPTVTTKELPPRF